MSDVKSEISFHDAAIASLAYAGMDVVMDLENVLVGDQQRAVRATIKSIVSVTRNEVPDSLLVMEAPDGDVLKLNAGQDGVLLVVQWHACEDKEPAVVVYRLLGATLETAVESS